MEEVTRRDLFAMAALQGLLASPGMVKGEDLAKTSYHIADAMIFEANKPFDIVGCPIDPPEPVPENIER